jgi:hypothetical protein
MSRRLLLLLAMLSAVVLIAAACGEEDVVEDVAADVEEDEDVAADVEEDDYDISDQPDDAAARFVAPSDGDTVSSPVRFEMEADGVEIVPAGPRALGEAHFHILVDLGCADEGEFLPGPGDEAEEQGYYHFGDGSTEAELELEPGTYDVCLQLADGVHAAFGETDTIEITVE